MKRTSTVERQRQQILNYASENGLTVDMFLRESKIESLKSSIKTDNHTLIFANIVALGITLSLLKKLVPDDTLVIENVSFLGANVHEIITTLNAVSGCGINLCLAQENISFKADKLPEIASSLLLAFRIHQSLISLRSKTALQERKSQGVKLGRPYGSNPALTLDGHKEEIKKLLLSGMSKDKIAEQYNVCRSTVYNFVKKNPDLLEGKC